MGGMNVPPADGDRPSEQPGSDGSNTLILHKCSSRVPEGIPQVIFSEDEDGRLAFSSLGGKGAVSERVSSRLADAVRHSVKTSGKELKSVLIVDDEPIVLELLTETLLAKGFRVIRTLDGRTGVEFATNYVPEVIILDLSMPGLGGVQIVEQLRAQPCTKDIPILINTGAVPTEEERQRLAGHVQSIIFKTEQKSLFTELDRLSAANEEAVEMEANV
jgi:CheY-like chemotaxis protein